MTIIFVFNTNLNICHIIKSFWERYLFPVAFLCFLERMEWKIIIDYDLVEIVATHT